MAWDKNLPDGGVSIAQGDDDIRANNDAIETGFDLEHRFTTGGNQSGRHTFVLDTPTNISALTNVDSGSIAFDTVTRGATTPCLRVYDGSVWRQLDIGTADVARLDENTQFTAAQEAQWLQITAAASVFTIDMSLQPLQYGTITGNVTIANPTNPPAATYSTQIVLQMTMDGAGGHSISWGTQYRSANGVAPAYNDAGNSVNYFVLTYMQTGNTLVTSLPAVSSF